MPRRSIETNQHRIVYHGSPNPTLGVEVEIQIIDPETRNLVSGAQRILEACNGNPHVKQELVQSTVEVNTEICDNITAVRTNLGELLADLQEKCDELGYLLAISGTHPFARWEEQDISPDPRYHLLVDRCQWPARRIMIFGLHVHVGVSSGEKAIAISNALTTYIPHLLALSASSPFWNKEDSGLASCRVKVFESLPTAGLPYRLINWGEFQRFMNTLRAAGAIESIRDIWWDLRPHPGFGTVELRICDGLSTLDEIVNMTALMQALVVWLGELYDAGQFIPVHRYWTVRENKWRAARYALDADLIVDDEGGTKPLREEIDELIEVLTPVAKRLGSHQELLGVKTMIERGPSYIRQRKVYQETGSFEQVVDTLVTELRENKVVEV